MIIYKIDVMKSLAAKGYIPSVIRKKGLFPEATIQKFRKEKMVGIHSLDMLCEILELQPGDIIEYVED